MSRVGLVTTFRFVPAETHEEGQATIERCWSTLSSFLLFHLAKGVEHVFLYADADDGSNRVYIERVARDFNVSQVSVDVRDASQRERQRASSLLWRELGSFSATEVPARQSLNAEDALRKAGKMGFDWLLHLDIDELFYTSEASIRPHFDRLNELGVEQMTYANHEAVPSCEDVVDYFREVNLFRVNHLLLPLSRTVGNSTRFWRRRTSHGQYMLAYDNGKAAVRVLPGRIVPQSVHRWRTLKPEEKSLAAVQGSGLCGIDAASLLSGHEAAGVTVEGRTGSEGGTGEVSERSEHGSGHEAPLDDRLVNRVAMADPRELHFDELLECSDPCVLHYPSCGLDWLRDKYRLLGSFPSSWFGGKLPIAPCFHLDARNAMREGAASPHDGIGEVGEDDGSRELYRKEVMLCPDEHAEEIRAQLEHGVLRVITGPASVIKSALNARVTPGSAITPMAMLSSGDTGTEAGGEGMRERDVASALVAEALGGEGSAVASQSVPLGQAGNKPLATASLEGDAVEDLAASAGFENSWILAACAREFL